MKITDIDISELKELSLKYPSCAKVIEMLERDSVDRYVAVKKQLAAFDLEIQDDPISLRGGKEKDFERVAKYLDNSDKWDANLKSIFNRLTTDEKEEAIDKTKKPKKQSSQIPATLKRN
jgi:hypothetical protein